MNGTLPDGSIGGHTDERNNFKSAIVNIDAAHDDFRAGFSLSR
jgi:hypothetical protein